ncbi:metal ABC transporter ATP-binding protein [Clostridium felsineum]|uniref:High-affinity zinc uptake system ATP-binding protein ZnuC n=1 Tax=Clostridium felsineum TaxID=36839 RepID=A0A1S8M2B4_9CLOT|nr:metal ABC transporter ATP-binding protein [Clostridium felsineum]MCR3758376.1 metal ABC transporter ATP-binding protein [Clostridium felsineum]URZ03737.1 High-affinity zinc uptake system ATP-binding protein ZnuC [Clostridium felsineum]URZ07957.1 High-affinity zinc uptake system ATP-binding protein ZnuC [Clostridium felsineum]URZ12988.1 High-affinity zinc uptake system ATP-binding protein ZnuC [Clostridium felsineum]URZ15021.1 High-affinity zinc uptake system ATP-binding protein ZnuC [Clostr
MISIKNLYFSYSKDSNYVIDDLNLHIKNGSYTSILGQNGTGKSTLIKLILGLLKPVKGNITISTNKIGYVPQSTENFNFAFPITVRELLLCHAKSLKLKSPESTVIKSLKLLGMENFQKNLIGSLSGGQKQKIFIARSLIGNPELLILDEPSTGVDVKSQKEIYGFLKKINKENNVTIICVEHNLKAAYSNSTHILNFHAETGSLLNINEFLRNNMEVVNND